MNLVILSLGHAARMTSELVTHSSNFLTSPNRRHPSYCTITRAVQLLYKTGSCNRRIPLSRATPSSLRIPAEEVLGYALAHPKSSDRDISKACSYSKSTVRNILHTYSAYPYRPVLAQELMPGGQERCFDFCNFVLNTQDENPEILNEVFGRINASSRGKGTINTQNTHYWSFERPTSNTIESPRSALVSTCVVRNMEKHRKWKMEYGKASNCHNVFLWTFNIRIIHEILSGPLTDFLEDKVSFRDLSRMWYQHVVPA
ncbi:uncharacterized protein TNCV_690931 [Trichonephila clavipes]|nr:uncharacterized protein TNCV_690931 [Trichonephila clavipes]